MTDNPERGSDWGRFASPNRRIGFHYTVLMPLSVLTSLILCSLTMGCRTEEHFFDVTGELFVLSAAEHYDDALRRARQWRDDAYLGGARASVAASAADARPAAGLTYMFHSPTTPHSFYILRFSAGGWNAEEDTKTALAVTPAPIERADWSLDSVDAWSIALANGGEDFLLHYQDPMTAMDVTLDYWGTRTGEEVLAWRANYLIVYGPTLDILIDPKDGDIIEIEERSMTGTLVATTPTLPATPWPPLPICTPASPEPGRVTHLPERIAFECTRDGVSHIYLMDPDGSNIVQLTDGPGADSSAAWSPDGTHIVFTSERDGNPNIYLMDADGSNLVRLTNHPARDDQPTWSPDGTRIAFTSQRDGNPNIYIMDADGSNLTPLNDHPLHDDGPDWSPDGCRIAFESDRDNLPDTHIYVINVDGSRVNQLTAGPSEDFQPKWSPDGTKIAFWSVPTTEGAGWHNVFVMNDDGSGKVRLTNGTCPRDDLVWSPRLAKIAFWSVPSTEAHGGHNVSAMDRHGSDDLPLTAEPCGGHSPIWSPDGNRILFAISRADPYGSDVFIMDADGSNVEQLTYEPGYNIPCSWRP